MISLSRKRIDLEALAAYLSRRPQEGIKVEWKKDQDLLVGRVSFDDKQFTIQAKDSKSFIYMVTEAVLVSLDVPPHYVNHIISTYPPLYQPNEETLDALEKNSSGRYSVRSKEKFVTVA